MQAAAKNSNRHNAAKTASAQTAGNQDGPKQPKLSTEAKAFIQKATKEHGISLKDRLLLAIKDGANHLLSDVFRRLQNQIPAALAVADAKAADTKEVKAGRRALLVAALELLEKAKRVSVKGSAAADKIDGATIKLVPPEPDERFEIDEEFKKELPPHTPSEIAALEHMLLTEGCRDPLIVCELDGRTFLADGHMRQEICLRHGISYEVTSISQPHRKAVATWIWDYQGSQRNFTRQAERYHRDRSFNDLELPHGGTRSKAQSEPLNANVVAAKFNISKTTITRDAKFAKAVDTITSACGQRGSEFRGKLLSGLIKLSDGKVKALAEKNKNEIVSSVKSLLDGEKIKLGAAKRTGFVRLALRRNKPDEQAKTLLESLGAKQAAQLAAELDKLLQGKAGEPAQDGTDNKEEAT